MFFRGMTIMRPIIETVSPNHIRSNRLTEAQMKELVPSNLFPLSQT